MTPDFANTALQTAQIVADCWREVLGLAVIEPKRNFFDLGGTSVHAIVLHTKLRERLPAHDFTVTTIFQHPTIAGFLEAIAPATGASLTASPAGADRVSVPRPVPGVRGVAPLTVRQRAERQQQHAGGGQSSWAVPRS